MSEAKRYRLDPESYLAGHPQGDFVDYQDYARLKAEVDRLTKVGNEMADYLFDAPYPCRIFYHKWIEAKEGKGQP